MADRLEAGPANRIDRDKLIAFTFDGRMIHAHPGDTVGSALAVAGVRTLSRSFKYHRPRGLLCCAGRCPNCLVDVDGVPSVRACIAPARDGITVRHQNAWPSLGLDIMSLTGRFDRLLPIGFYYKIFHRPRFLWPFFEGIIRRVAGLGRIDPLARPDVHARTRHLHAEVTVIGGGGAGCLAALEAAAAGARVILVDEGEELGGHWRQVEATVHGDPRIEGLPGYAAARRLGELVKEHPGSPLTDERDSVVPAIFEVGDPLAQREGIMFAQRLDIAYLEAGPLHRSDGVGHVEEFTVGEHIAAHERPASQL